MTRPELLSHVTDPIRVTYRDTDRMNHAYHANYLVWFEIGRTELLRCQGQAYKDWEEQRGIYLPVRRCSVEYLQPAFYDDLLTVRTAITKLTKATIHFHYELRRHDGTLLSTGETDHVFVSEEGRILRVAHELLPALYKKPSGP